mgnify:CR=1 FL=1
MPATPEPTVITADACPGGLERSCSKDWVRRSPDVNSLNRIEAFFGGEAYTPHRHDTYSIGYTLQGVQSFRYRGSQLDSTPGKVIVLHPDELHDGRAGNESGFSYRMLCLQPSMVRDALGCRASSLPFAKDAVREDQKLIQALRAAYSVSDVGLEPVRLDHIVLQLSEGLLALDPSAKTGRETKIDSRAVKTAQEYLYANLETVVRSQELERVTQLNRYTLARQFRRTLGTSPYRYLTMRRLDRVRQQLAGGATLADASISSGFSDQAHMTRHFKASFGMSPGRWQRLQRMA